MNDTTVYYIIKKDKIVDIILNNKDKAEELLNKLQKDPTESDWLPSRIEECKAMECSNGLVEGINKVYTITLNEEIVYTIINNEFTAIKVYNHLVSMSQTDEYPREYKIRCDKVEYKINKKAKSHYDVKVFTEDKGQSLNYNDKVYFVIMKNVNKFGITSDYDNIENTANEIAYNQLCIKDLQREMTMIDDEEYFNELNERNKRIFNNERKKYEVKEVIGRKNINKVFKELYDMFGNPVINKLDEKYEPLICGITYIFN